MGANPHANGGMLLKDLRLPDFRDYAVPIPTPGAETGEATRVLGAFLRDVTKLNQEARNFRVFGPDETASNRLDALFETTSRELMAKILPGDDHLSHDGRVLEVLERTHVRRLAGRLPAHRPPRLVQLLRGVHSHCRFDVQPARQVVEGSLHGSRGAGPSRV